MRLIVTCAICLLALKPGMAQEKTALVASPGPLQTEVAAIPDAPTPSPVPDGEQSPSASTTSSASGAPAQPDQGQQTKRILWIVPNFRAVSAGAQLPPQSVKEKFKTAALDSFDYSSFIFVGIQAGISQVTDSYPAFHQAPRDTADTIGTLSQTRQMRTCG